MKKQKFETEKKWIFNTDKGKSLSGITHLWGDGPLCGKSKKDFKNDNDNLVWFGDKQYFELANCKECIEELARFERETPPLIYLYARMDFCYCHHLDGSDLEHKNHLFSLIFNDFRRIIRNGHYNNKEESTKFLTFEQATVYNFINFNLKKIEKFSQLQDKDTSCKVCEGTGIDIIKAATMLAHNPHQKPTKENCSCTNCKESEE